MLGFLKALLLLPVAIVVVLLAIANRAPVTFSLDPFGKGAPDIAVSLPLYGLLLAAVGIGVVIGGVGSWLSSGRSRRSGRAARREAARLRAEAERLRRTVAASRMPALAAPSRAA